ncbi:ComF family protein, partial [Patescibacteria group bacterium]|nr:ComF family protein [Patescibacteria group bacterium]
MWPKRFFSFLLTIIFPPLCLVCKKRGEIICQKCFENIQINNGFYCPQCHRRLPEPKNTCHPQVKFVLAAASSYQNQAVRKLIHALKYQNIKQTAEPLVQILSIYLEKIGLIDWLKKQDFIIIPIPLHPKKEKERGFNVRIKPSKSPLP